jgi:hypothetical protein
MGRIMSKFSDSKQGIMTLMGMSLLAVQSAERALGMALNTVFAEPSSAQKAKVEIMEGQRPTLGYFIRQLRGRVKLERAFTNKLYRFLELRNIFVHDLKEIPGGWDLKTQAGRERAHLFLGELLFMAGATQAVFVTAVTISAKEDFGEDITDGHELIVMVEKAVGPFVRRMLAAR